MRSKYSDEQLAEAVKKCTSYRQVLKFLSLVEAGGNYVVISRKIKQLRLDTSHFTGRGWNRGLIVRLQIERPLEEILVANSTYQSHKLRKRLLKENYFDAKCYKCHLSEWLDHPIPLELEHIDGDRSNNLLNNLTLLCPNCHALTGTWRRRKK